VNSKLDKQLVHFLLSNPKEGLDGAPASLVIQVLKNNGLESYPCSVTSEQPRDISVDDLNSCFQFQF